MKVYKRLALKDWSITAENGDCFVLKAGQTYTTSNECDGKIVVFAGFWVAVPTELFSEGVEI